MGDAESVSSWRSQLGTWQVLGSHPGQEWRLMARFMPYPYTSVSNGSTFGLLHTHRNSSIVSISASTLVLRFGTGRKSIQPAGSSAGTRECLSKDLECASV